MKGMPKPITIPEEVAGKVQPCSHRVEPFELIAVRIYPWPRAEYLRREAVAPGGQNCSLTSALRFWNQMQRFPIKSGNHPIDGD